MLRIAGPSTDEIADSLLEAIEGLERAHRVRMLDTLRAFLGCCDRDDLGAAFGAVLELPLDDFEAAVARWRDRLLSNGAEADEVRARIRALQEVLDLASARDLVAQYDLGPMMPGEEARRAAEALASARPGSRAWLQARVMSDAYLRSVFVRLLGVGGVVPTEDVLRGLLDLGLVPADEPRVATLIVSIVAKGVIDPIAEVIDPLRRA